MDDELRDLLSGSGAATPIRRTIRLRITPDENGVQKTEVVDGEAFVLSGEGSVDQVEATQDQFFNCGCFRTPENLGGQCATPGCGRTSCQSCFSACRCSRCGKPQCREHTRFLRNSEKVVPLCVVCEDFVNRRAFWHRLLPSPDL